MKEFNRISIAFAHFLTVKADDGSYFVANLRYGQFEDGAVQFIEFDSDIACNFEVLLLILAYGYDVALIQQDVCRHQ